MDCLNSPGINFYPSLFQPSACQHHIQMIGNDDGDDDIFNVQPTSDRAGDASRATQLGLSKLNIKRITECSRERERSNGAGRDHERGHMYHQYGLGQGKYLIYFRLLLLAVSLTIHGKVQNDYVQSTARARRIFMLKQTLFALC